MSRGHLSHADILSTFTDDQLAKALDVTEAHLARRPSWRVGEACVRMLVEEQKRRAAREAA